MSNEAPTQEQADFPKEETGQEQADAPPTGPRGGTTTITASGMVKKNFWVPEEIAERLRRAAFEERISEADIMRRGVELALEELE